MVYTIEKRRLLRILADGGRPFGRFLIGERVRNSKDRNGLRPIAEGSFLRTDWCCPGHIPMERQSNPRQLGHRSGNGPAATDGHGARRKQWRSSGPCVFIGRALCRWRAVDEAVNGLAGLADGFEEARTSAMSRLDFVGASDRLFRGESI
jgi:hypothetical protein